MTTFTKLDLDKLTDNNKKDDSKNPIEFVRFVSLFSGESNIAKRSPSYYEHVILLKPGEYTAKYDLMVAYNNHPCCSLVNLYLGHWNDGYV